MTWGFGLLLGVVLTSTAFLVRARLEQNRFATALSLVDALLRGTSEGVLVIDARGRAARSNAPARALLGPGYRAATWSVARSEPLHDLVERARSDAVEETEITMLGRVVLVSAVPLGDGRVLLRLKDVSEIRRLERVRTDFVANASHELKTPLTALRGFAETLLDDEEPPAELRRRFIESIHTNAIRLQNLVEDLLDLTRLESGGWRPDLTPLLVGPLVRQAWEEVTQARGRQTSFSLSGEGIVLGDERGLLHILRNLLDNSLRHTPDDGRIDVTISQGPETVTTAVADTGSGIPAEALPRIFERFYRADPARSRQEGGTGLGLAIVSHMVEAMGGRVSAASEKGRGTTMSFVLPRVRGAPPRHAPG